MTGVPPSVPLAVRGRKPDVRFRGTNLLDSAAPTILIGDGRSGTTLTALLLSAHPDLHVMPELHFTAPPDLGPSIAAALQLRRDGDPRVSSPGLQQEPELLLAVQFLRRCNRAGLGDEVLARLVAESRAETGTDLRLIADRLVLVERIGRVLADAAGSPRWGLKLMKALQAVPDMCARWQGLCCVHVVRDGRDVAVSQVRDMRWGYADYPSAASGWADFVARVEAMRGGLPVVTVRYEDLVLRTEATARLLLEHLGLPWNEQVLRHHDSPHPLLDSTVRHDSAAAASAPISTARVGRHRAEMSRSEIEAFNETAGGLLDHFGYRIVPKVGVSFLRDSPLCADLSSCATYHSRILERIGQRFFTAHEFVDPPVRSAVLDMTGHDYESYERVVKKTYKGGVLRDAKKAREQGFRVHQFARGLHIPDIAAINQSMEVRSGGQMKAAYLRSVEEMGGAPSTYSPPPAVDCPVHYDVYWGAFEAHEGYRQGEVTTDERLVAYVNVRRLGSFAMYNLILGHGDYLRTGIMYYLHFEIMKWMLGNARETEGLCTLVYAGFYQGGQGLQLWKKKTGFEPAHLVLDPVEMTTATSEG